MQLLASILISLFILLCLSQFFPCSVSIQSFQCNSVHLSLIRFFPCWQKGCNELAESCVVACREAFRPLFDRGSCTITGLMALCVARYSFFHLLFKASHFKLPLAIWVLFCSCGNTARWAVHTEKKQGQRADRYEIGVKTLWLQSQMNC